MPRPDPRRAVAAVLALLLAAPAAAQVTDGGQRIAALGAAEREELQRRAADWDALPAPMRRALSASRMPKPTPTGMPTTARICGMRRATSSKSRLPAPVTPFSET